jgi:hypothetical protein
LGLHRCRRGQANQDWKEQPSFVHTSK